MFIVAGIAHCPALGVKVYKVVPAVAVLTRAGAQVPEIAGKLVELAGNTGANAPWQTFGIAVNVGVIWLVILTVMEVLVAHCPAEGVNV